MLSTMTWRRPSGELVNSKEIEDIINDKNYEIYVGSDSHVLGGNTVFATVIAAWKPGCGGKFLYSRETSKGPNFFRLHERLTEEAIRSIAVASELRDEYGRDVEIHLDLNTEKYKSSKYTKELSSMVTACGFKCEVKPNSWASSTLADKSAR